MNDLQEVFTKLAARGHSIKPSKMRFLQIEVEYLGRVSTEEGVLVTPRHKSAVAGMPPPTDEGGEVDRSHGRDSLQGTPPILPAFTSPGEYPGP